MECFKDLSLPTKSHEKGLIYVKNILKIYNENVETITLENLYKILTTFKTKYGTNLSYGSIKFIVSVITKFRNGWNDKILYKNFKRALWEKRFETETVKITKTEEDAIQHGIDVAIQNFNANHKTKSLYETGLMVLIVLTTNFRSSEIQQLKLFHLHQLLKGESISIRVKKKIKPIYCIVNKDLLLKIITLVTKQERYKSLTSNLFTLSKVTLNKTFKKLCNLPQTSRIGVQGLRKVITTNIINNTSLEVAQTFNRHNNKSVTDQYYNTQSYITSYIDNIFKTIP
ncbi:VLF-1 [Dikerogammarus haemobaphes nudivirus]|nr:VLF-1 [Dikerogammarus haemobaphes nudivirus]